MGWNGKTIFVTKQLKKHKNMMQIQIEIEAIMVPILDVNAEIDAMCGVKSVI